MSQPLSKIVLRKFRGASGTTELNLASDARVVVLFGENGTGKSSIIDGLDVLANDGLGSLEGRSSAKKTEYLATIGHDVSDIAITVHAGSNQWTAKIGKRKCEVAGPSPRPRIHVLRRFQLLKLIEAEPTKRYAELQRFIDVTGVERAEQALRDALAEADREATQLARDVVDAQDHIHRQWVDEGRPGKVERKWARTKSSADTGSLDAKAAALAKAMKAIGAARRADEELRETAAEVKEARGDVKLVEERIAEASASGPAESVELVRILRGAAEYLQPPRQTGECPVCRQRITVEKLREAIEERLNRMAEFEDLEDARAEAKQNFETASKRQEKARERLVREAGILLNVCRHTDAAAMKTLTVDWSAYARLLSSDEKFATLAKLAQELLALVTPLEDALEDELKSVRNHQGQLSGLRASVQKLEEAEHEAGRVEALRERLKKALEVVEGKRKKFTQGILDGVTKECNRLYSAIHVNESLGDLKVTLDPERKNSIHQEVKFAGKKVAPQAYFSDSHLDTLGFCVWLALAKREDPEDTIIALDDIFTSVDAPHLTRIIGLLADESSSFRQVIVTTHFRPWRDRYRLGQGQGRNVQLFELHPWTLNRGICLTRTKLAVDDLAAKLASVPLDRQGVGSMAGILLEAVLDHLTAQYRCAVARSRDGLHTLGDLLDGASKLFKVLAVEETSADGNGGKTARTPLLPLVDAVRALQFIRNQVGCHFNPDGLGIADNDVQDFGKATVALARAVTCPSCGDIPSRDKGTHWACGCGGKYMTPLSSPTSGLPRPGES